MPHIIKEPTIGMELIPPEPFSPEAELAFYTKPYEDPSYTPPEEPASWTAGFSASFALQNPLFNALDTFKKEFDPVEGFDPFTDPSIEGYDPMFFAKSMSPDENSYIKEQLDINSEMLALSSSAPLSASLLGGAAGALTSPTVLPTLFVPGGPLIAGLVGVAGEVTNELLLHSQQSFRTKLESAANIGLVGAGAGVSGAFRQAGWGGRVEAEVKPSDVVIDINRQPAGMGAAVVQVTRETAEDISVVSPWLVKLLGGTKISPAADILVNSQSKIAKQTTTDLVETSIRLNKEKGTFSIESANLQAEGDIASMQGTFQTEFKAYRKAGGGMKIDEFNEAVADAMRAGEVHPIPEVVKVAKAFREFDQKYFDMAKSLGLYDKTVLKGSAGHLQRIYNRKAILANRPKLKSLLMHALGREEVTIVRDAEGTFAIKPGDWAELKAQRGAEVDIVVGVELNDVVDGIIMKMQGRETMLDYADSNWAVSKAGSLHERSLDFLTDAELKPFLENNASAVMAITSHQMTRSINMVKRFGDVNMKARMKELELEYNELMNIAKTGKERTKLDNRMNKDKKTLLAFRDQLMGNYGAPDTTRLMTQASRWARTYTLLTMGLNIPTASISDIMAPALRAGFRPFYSGIKSLMASGKGKAYREYIRKLGLATESVNNSRAVAFADAAFMSKSQRTLQRIWGKYTLMNTFTDVTQFMNAMSTSEMWLGWMAKPLGKGNARKLLDMGIDADMAKRISKQHKEFPGKAGAPDSFKWADREAAEAFENGLRKEVRTTTIVPGIGDTPLFMKDNEAGRFVGMFKTFLASAHMKFLIAGLQRSDADYLTGLLMMTTGGMLVAALKSGVRGEDITDKDLDDLLLQAVDRAGVMGWLSPPASMAKSILTGEGPSTYAFGNTLQSSFIPAPASAVIKGVTGAYGAAAGDEQAVWKFLKAVPGANAQHTVDLLQTFTDSQPERK